MLVTTTPTIENATITDYKGLVTGEAIVGANIVKDLFASMRDIVGGRSKAYEDELQTARTAAMEEIVARATGMGANAVIGVDVDYETIGSSGSMLMVSVTGTAVVISSL